MQKLGQESTTIQLATKEVIMVSKIPIVAERIRKVPSHFSWIDHRLVRDRRIENCGWLSFETLTGRAA